MSTNESARKRQCVVPCVNIHPTGVRVRARVAITDGFNHRRRRRRRNRQDRTKVHGRRVSLRREQ